MKIPCEIIRDLLPLYVDGVCSNESKKAIQEHLQDCTLCQEELRLMGTDIQCTPPPTEEEAPVKAATAAWKRGKHKAFFKGGIITLIVLGLIAAILCHCLIPITISPQSFQTGDVFQHRVFRWNMPVFVVRLLCPKPMRKDLSGIPTGEYDRLLWMHRACIVNGEKGDLSFYFDDGLAEINIIFQETKDPEWSEQLLEEFREHYGPETRTITTKNGKIMEYVWQLGDSCLFLSAVDSARPHINILKTTESK